MMKLRFVYCIFKIYLEDVSIYISVGIEKLSGGKLAAFICHFSSISIAANIVTSQPFCSALYCSELYPQETPCLELWNY